MYTFRAPHRRATRGQLPWIGTAAIVNKTIVVLNPGLISVAAPLATPKVTLFPPAATIALAAKLPVPAVKVLPAAATIALAGKLPTPKVTVSAPAATIALDAPEANVDTPAAVDATIGVPTAVIGVASAGYWGYGEYGGGTFGGGGLAASIDVGPGEGVITLEAPIPALDITDFVPIAVPAALINLTALLELASIDVGVSRQQIDLAAYGPVVVAKPNGAFCVVATLTLEAHTPCVNEPTLTPLPEDILVLTAETFGSLVLTAEPLGTFTLTPLSTGTMTLTSDDDDSLSLEPLEVCD